MKKRGQTGGEVIKFLGVLLIIAIIVWGVYSYFSKINNAIDLAGIEGKAAIESCTIALERADTDDAKLTAYCKDTTYYPVYVGKVKNYVSCVYLEKSKTVFSDDAVPKSIKAQCTQDIRNQAANDQCWTFIDVHRTDGVSFTEYVNGLKCTKNGWSDFTYPLTKDYYDKLNGCAKVSKGAKIPTHAKVTTLTDAELSDMGYVADKKSCAA